MWNHALVHIVNFSPTLFLLVLFVVSTMDGQAIIGFGNLPEPFLEDKSSGEVGFWNAIIRLFAYTLWTATNGPLSDDEWVNLCARTGFIWALANVAYSIIYPHKVRLVVSSGLLFMTTLSYARYYIWLSRSVHSHTAVNHTPTGAPSGAPPSN